MLLPSLNLPLSLEALRRMWNVERGKPCVWKRWENLRGRDKRALLHDPAVEAFARSVYELVEAEELMDQELYSVEHVLPRSKVNDSAAGAAEDDPLGWVQATRKANSRRGSLPLILWPPSDEGPWAMPNTIVIVESADGAVREAHYSPPAEMRARLARKWIYMRFEYGDIDVLAPPSRAQWERSAEICAFAQHSPPSEAERAVDAHFREHHGCGNPLIGEDRAVFLSEPAFRRAVFGRKPPV
jgi:hypothetical protein